MSVTRAPASHLSPGKWAVVLLALTTLGAGATPAQTAQAGAPGDGLSRFTVIIRGVRIGTESVDVSRTLNGIKISSVGQLAPPVDLVTSKFEMLYGVDGHPQKLTIEGQLRGLPLTLNTSFGVTTAISDLVQGAQKGTVTHEVSPRAIVLPRNFFGAYEALAARLVTLAEGARIAVYAVPEGEIIASIDGITNRRIVTPEGSFELKQYDLSVVTGSGTGRVQVWADANGRLARIVLPAASLVVMRDDLSSVMAREESIRNAGDEDVFIGAAGFNLGATVTKPSGAPGRTPAVVLVGGPGSQDRDELSYGVPKFGLIAGELAAAGHFVVRYDKRGVGQSGGRPEHAGLAEYAADVTAIVTWLRKRKDIDPDRIVLLGYAEGAAVALTAAGRDSKISGVALVAAAGSTGREITLEQQRLSLIRLKEPEASRQAKTGMQIRIIEAVLTGKGWEAIPEDLRHQADTPWFKSWLLFDPAAAINKLKQPILIVHGALDREIPAAHADRLEAAGQARRNVAAARTRKVVIPGVNHLLTAAETGEVEEYDLLGARTLAPPVGAAIVEWLKAHAGFPR
jgi:pimeloyl-ACP methyl ester carboxylesterase